MVEKVRYRLFSGEKEETLYETCNNIVLHDRDVGSIFGL